MPEIVEERSFRITAKGIWVIERWNALTAEGIERSTAFDMAVQESLDMSGHEKAALERAFANRFD